MNGYESWGSDVTQWTVHVEVKVEIIRGGSACDDADAKVYSHKGNFSVGETGPPHLFRNLRP